MNIKTFGDVDQRSLEQLERCMEAGDAEFGVLCADHHPGYSQPIGGGIAYEGYVSPSGVGYDIGCGNKAARTELTRADLDALGGVDSIMGEITRRISFGVGVPAQERVDHPVLEKIRSADFAPQRKLAQLAESQLGTVGSGNHYVNLMEDEEGRIWVGVHFGSRGFGHRTASGFLALAQGSASASGRTRVRWTRRRCSSRSGPSSASRTSRRWSWQASTHTPVATPSSTRCSRSSAPSRRTRCTTTTTSRGGRSTSAHILGRPQGLHARPPGPGGLRRRLDGRRGGHPRGRRGTGCGRVAVLDGAWRRSRHEPLAGRRSFRYRKRS